MSNRLFALFVVAALWLAPSYAAGVDSRGHQDPIVVVSAASYEKLMANIELVGKLGGRPQLAEGIEGMLAVVTQGKGLAGLDKKRPWGIVLEQGEPRPNGYAFLPVEDWQALLVVLQPYLSGTEDAGGGIVKLRAKNRRRPSYVRHVDSGWLFVSDDRQRLTETPDDPLSILGDLPTRYDLAVRLNADHATPEQREQFVAKMRERAQSDLTRRDDESDLDHAVRNALGRCVLETVIAAVPDMKAFTLGCRLDEYTGKALLELDISAREESNTGEFLKQWTTAKTGFRGFCVPGATVTGGCVVGYNKGECAHLSQLLDAVRAKSFDDIETREGSGKRAEVRKEIVGALLEIFQETVASGRIDGVMSMIVEANSATLVTGRYVADESKFEDTLERFIDAARRENPGFVNQAWKANVGEFRNIRFHTLSLKVPHDAENRRAVVRLVGEVLEIVIGIGPRSVYLAAGRDAMTTLRNAIEMSDDTVNEPAAPMELSLSLGDLGRFVAQTGKHAQREQAQTALDALSGSAGKDHLRLLAQPVEAGLRIQLELEAGAVEMIQVMRRQQRSLKTASGGNR